MGLDIVVCIKSVILTAPEEQMLRTEDTSELNPFDRPVLEAALRLKELHGGRVTVISMGPEASLSALSEARAMGVDREILISDPALVGSDTLATSTALGAGLRKLVPFDLVLFGVRTADSDTGQVGPQTSVQLGIPFISMVKSLEWQKDVFRVERVADHFLEEYEVATPAAFTIHPGAFQPRDMGLSGIGRAFESERVERWNLADLGLMPERVGDAGSPTRVLSMKRIKETKKCEFLKGNAREQADELMKRLSDSGAIGA
ncbi:MAG: electron transfer flavoprotein subunit beta/FixA family protein [Deltaproteobacteria bacterium]|nr:electron transfer flavoprotein subunit beta/FixA family protein [Deltaproteobacteria bacterium]